MTASSIDTQDIYVEKVNPANPHQVLEGGRWVDLVAVKEGIAVKGPLRAPAVGIRIHDAWAGDRDRPRQAPRLPPSMERCRAGRRPRARGARDRPRAVLVRVSRGSRALEDATRGVRLRRCRRPHRPSGRGPDADPRRMGGRHAGAGRDPCSTSGADGSRSIACRAVSDPPTGVVASANGNEARFGRISDVLADPAARGIEGFQRLQQDVLAWNAERLVPLLTRVAPDRADLDEARQRLLRWDRRITSRFAGGGGLRGLGTRALAPARGASASIRPG